MMTTALRGAGLSFMLAEKLVEEYGVAARNLVSGEALAVVDYFIACNDAATRCRAAGGMHEQKEGND